MMHDFERNEQAAEIVLKMKSSIAHAVLYW